MCYILYFYNKVSQIKFFHEENTFIALYIFIGKNPTYKWICAFETHVVQGSLVPSHWELGFQHMNSREKQTFNPWHSLSSTALL